MNISSLKVERASEAIARKPIKSSDVFLCRNFFFHRTILHEILQL